MHSTKRFPRLLCICGTSVRSYISQTSPFQRRCPDPRDQHSPCCQPIACPRPKLPFPRQIQH